MSFNQYEILLRRAFNLPDPRSTLAPLPSWATIASRLKAAVKFNDFMIDWLFQHPSTMAIGLILGIPDRRRARMGSSCASTEASIEK